MNPQTTQCADAPSPVDPVVLLLLDALSKSEGHDPVHVIGACARIVGQFASQLRLHGPVAELLRACADELEADASARGPLQ